MRAALKFAMDLIQKGADEDGEVTDALIADVVQTTLANHPALGDDAAFELTCDIEDCLAVRDDLAYDRDDVVYVGHDRERFGAQ